MSVSISYGELYDFESPSQYWDSVTVPAGSSTSRNITMPTGKYVLGGGCSGVESYVDLGVVSTPTGGGTFPNIWSVTLLNPTASDITVSRLWVYATCARVANI